MFPVQGAGVQSLVRKVSFLVPHGVAKKKKNRDSNLTWHPVFSFAKSGNATLKSSFYIILAQLPILQMGKQKRLNVLTQLSVATPGFEAGLLTSSLATQYTIK